MRSMMRAALVAVALGSVVPVVSVQAQAKKVAPVVIPVTKVPKTVMNTLKSTYPAGKITKVDQTGSGKTAVYHFTMAGTRATDVKINGAGSIVK